MIQESSSLAEEVDIMLSPEEVWLGEKVEVDGSEGARWNDPSWWLSDPLGDTVVVGLAMRTEARRCNLRVASPSSVGSL